MNRFLKTLAIVSSTFSLSTAALAQGYPANPGSLNDNSTMMLCSPCVTTPSGPAKPTTALLSALATYMATKLSPMTSGPVNVAIIAGNSTGSYTLSGITASNKVLLVLPIDDNLTTTSYNFSPLAFLVAGNVLNPTVGWKPGTGVVTDPTVVNWTGYSMVVVYQ